LRRYRKITIDLHQYEKGGVGITTDLNSGIFSGVHNLLAYFGDKRG